MKVLISDNISPKGIEILKKAGLEVDVKVGMKPEELKACIGDYQGLVIRSATKVTSEIIDAATNLKVIGRAGSGLDNVDKTAATKKGIVVMNTPGGNTITTAEHTIALMVSLARQIPQATMSMKAGKWEKKKFMGVELFNKTLGIVGIGNIGSQVAKRMQAFAMNVIAYDPFLSEDKAKAMGVEKVDLRELFRRSDFITVHTPLTAETKNLINKETIAIMKHGVRIINCARGGIINEKDLYDALVEGKVAGAALDVFEKEPPENNPLLTLDTVICYSSSRRLDKGGAGKCCSCSCGTGGRLSCPRDNKKCCELPVDTGRPGRKASALYKLWPRNSAAFHRRYSKAESPR